MAIRAGMCRKIEDSFRNPVDGKPATKGTPLAAEARYYHNFFLADSEVSFDEFLAALSRELSSNFPSVTLNRDWIRECDRRGLLASARRDLSLLRAAVEHTRVFSVGVWDLLWKINEVYVDKFGLTHAQLGTSEDELRALARRFLAKECQKRVRALDTLMQSGSKVAARRMFGIIEGMLMGVPISSEDFTTEWQLQHATSGPYRAYVNATGEHRLSPETVGWSMAERNRIALLLFPKGVSPKTESAPIQEMDPTAPAISACETNIRSEAENECLSPTTNEAVIMDAARWAAERCAGLANFLITLLAIPDGAPQPC